MRSGPGWRVFYGLVYDGLGGVRALPAHRARSERGATRAPARLPGRGGATRRGGRWQRDAQRCRRRAGAFPAHEVAEPGGCLSEEHGGARLFARRCDERTQRTVFLYLWFFMLFGFAGGRGVARRCAADPERAPVLELPWRTALTGDASLHRLGHCSLPSRVVSIGLRVGAFWPRVPRGWSTSPIAISRLRTPRRGSVG
jgi:hypothetical protein